jgi:DNA-binding transcriptional MerR regulator
MNAKPAVHDPLEPNTTIDTATSSAKAPGAFRTISEVAEDLNVPQHVLRFWETRFFQVRPLKRGGGRRYYRPEDVALLKKIHHLLYSEGYTIRGVQKLLKGVSKAQLLKEQGIAPKGAVIDTDGLVDVAANHNQDAGNVVDDVVVLQAETAVISATVNETVVVQQVGLTVAQRDLLANALEELRELQTMIKAA